jgi:hypothetical protein
VWFYSFSFLPSPAFTALLLFFFSPNAECYQQVLQRRRHRLSTISTSIEAPVAQR